MQPIAQLILAGGLMFGILAVIAGLSGMYNLNIKAKTVGHGQHGTARWATKREIYRTYLHIPFEPELWRKGEHLPKEQGIVVGCQTDRHLPYNIFRVVRNLVVCRIRKHPGKPLPKPSTTTALVDTGDVHAIMIGAAGVGKTAYWLYPCLEYAMASGMSFLSTDTKGDVVRNYGRIAQECYGYRVGVIDLRNPTRSDGFNLLHLTGAPSHRLRGPVPGAPGPAGIQGPVRKICQDHLQDHHHRRDGRAELRAESVLLRRCRGPAHGHHPAGGGVLSPN